MIFDFKRSIATETKMLRKLIVYFIRKCFVFGTLGRPIIPFRINLLFYKRGKGKQNVGDLLSVVVFNYLLRYKHLNKWSFCTKRLALIGSIIQFIGAKTTVFGSGFLNEYSVEVFSLKKPELLIHAVRGPLTRCSLLQLGYKVPKVYGDPAVLMPKIYTPNIRKSQKYIVIPHYSKLNKYRGSKNVLSTLTNDWKSFIDAICSSYFVISSSLHGIILAEAYGVPAILLNDIESNSFFKYRDYYYSTGRMQFLMANSIEDALSKQDKVVVPDLSVMQQKLLAEFQI